MTVLASTIVPGFPTGSRWLLDGVSGAASILETGRSARADDYSGVEGTIAAAFRSGGFRSTVGVPIVVDGAVWGQLCIAATTAEPSRADAEDRMRDFTELVAIAISNAESRDRLRRLAEQQTSLRRVATLVAEGASPAELFSAVAEEVARILDVLARERRSLRARPHCACAGVGECARISGRQPLAARCPSLFASVFSTGAPARIDDYSGLPRPPAAGARTSGVQFGLAVPIVVDGRVWGMIAVGRTPRRPALPGFAGSYTGRIVYSSEPSADVEARLVAFTDLIATAISNAQAHDDLQRLAEEQAALRRVATLVAEAVPPDAIFTAVAEEVASILELPRIEVVRYEADGSGTVVGASGDHPSGPAAAGRSTAPAS